MAAILGLVVSWAISFFFANLFTCYPISPFIEAFYKHQLRRRAGALVRHGYNRHHC